MDTENSIEPENGGSRADPESMTVISLLQSAPFFLFFFFFTLHALRSGRIERDLMRSRTGRHYEIHLPSLPGGKANERK